jgi:hypothetical protein
MLSPLWWLPLAVAASAVGPIWRGMRRLEADAAGLQASVAELGRVRTLAAEVAAEIAAVAGRAPRTVPDLTRR